MFADLHNHNHSRTFFWVKPWQEKYKRLGRYNPWTVVASNMRARKKRRMASSYGQADLVKLWNGNVRLTFNSLYPIEKGFFKSNVFERRKDLKRTLIGLASYHHLPLRDVLQGLMMRIPQSMINFIQSRNYDYWQWLNEEYRFTISKNGEVTRNAILLPGAIRGTFESRKKRRKRYPKLLHALGEYRIPKTNQELQDAFGPERIVMVLTIEGTHALGTDKGHVVEWLSRVDEIMQNWEHPIFFITFAHHFDNKMCGHAHSLPDIATYLLDQSERMNGGFTSEGRLMLRKFLSLDENNDPKPEDGYRILIDVKHMSALSRKQFYDEVVRPCLAKGDVIPVIASHCGYTGDADLEDLIARQDQEKDDYFPTPGFNGWNINVCDEDIKLIFETEGLFGLSFDQRIVGVPSSQKKEGGRDSIIALWENVKAVVRVIYEDDTISNNKKSDVWKRITLGSDFEGFIDPVNAYPTAIEYQPFKEDLIAIMEEERQQNGGQLLGLQSVDDVRNVVENLCFSNAKDFVLKWYPDKN